MLWLRGAEPSWAAGGCWAGPRAAARHFAPVRFGVPKHVEMRHGQCHPDPGDRRRPSAVTCMRGGTLWPGRYNVPADGGPGRGSHVSVAHGHPGSCGASVSPFLNPLREQTLQVTQGQAERAGAAGSVLGWQQPGTECPLGQGCHPVPVDQQHTGSPQPKRAPVPCTSPWQDPSPPGCHSQETHWQAGLPKCLWSRGVGSNDPFSSSCCQGVIVPGKGRSCERGTRMTVVPPGRGCGGTDAAPPSPPPSWQHLGSYFCCIQGMPSRPLGVPGAVRPTTHVDSAGPWAPAAPGGAGGV